MITNSTATSQSTYTHTLTEAVAAFRGNASCPPAEAVVTALLEAEKAAKQQRLTVPFQALLGQWRLCFATSTRKAKQRGGIRLGRGWYLPKIGAARIAFNASNQASADCANRGDIANQASLGSLVLRFTGPCKYLGKKNLLAFDFTWISVSLFGRNLYQGAIRSGKLPTQDFAEQPVSQLPFFAFFLVTDDFIAARGRGGGLAIWVREY